MQFLRKMPCVLQTTHLPESMCVVHTSKNNAVFNLVKAILAKPLRSLLLYINISYLLAKIGLFSGNHDVSRQRLNNK